MERVDLVVMGEGAMREGGFTTPLREKQVMPSLRFCVCVAVREESLYCLWEFSVAATGIRGRASCQGRCPG
ncbi:hypothetical protein L484_027133 [Morus notabilis]|uniref:Uncharacterized protein n=1 Tax=Morus notabilis TaxID=981085 RepID=W9S102_9ROSA|nr:hypothetical protein L484_027133 [Morus notabilis]